MTQTTEERTAAIASLLPLLESHLDHHGRIVSRALWISPPDPPPPGWQPPPPEPDCDGSCSTCPDFHSRRCTLREERWAAEWQRLRAAYPQLKRLEALMPALMYERADWAAALYWVHIQPWDQWNVATRAEWARLGVEWLADAWQARGLGWVPTYGEGVPVRHHTLSDIARLRAEGLSIREIARAISQPKSTVHRALAKSLE